MLHRLRSLNRYERWMFVCVALAILLRLVLIYFKWPYTESDEGNMGIEAIHIAFRGELPIFFYGAPYMGPLEAYAAAPLFQLFGSSVFALRLPLVLFFGIFLPGMYYLVRLLYASEKFALFSVILLGLGSPDVLFLQLRASGEYPELLMFAALMCLLATGLAFSVAKPDRQRRWKRPVAYALLGLVIGLAVWVDLLILPFVAAIGLLLLLFCWRELIRWRGLAIVPGFVAGAFPLIYYNLTAPWEHNSWFVLRQLHEAGAADMLAQHLTWVDQLTGTMMVALPMATGGGVDCPQSAIPPAGSPTPETLSCLLFQSGWSLGYLILGLIATVLAVLVCWRIYRHMFPRQGARLALSLEDHQQAVRQAGRLLILVSVGLTLLLYAIAPAPAISASTSFRYLTCLLLALPVLLWPLWRGLSAPKRSIRWVVKLALLCMIALTFFSGTVRALAQIPLTVSEYQSKEAAVQRLLDLGATRIYSEYWTCNLLTFLSKEQIICDALDENLNPGYDRYLPYRAIVNAAPHPTYVFPANTPFVLALQDRLRSTGASYRFYEIEGYVVYQMT